MKKWWKCTLRERFSKRVLHTQYVYHIGAREALCLLQWFGGDYEPCAEEADPSEVPPVQRGMAEASLEQLFDEINKRGFKVVQQ